MIGSAAGAASHDCFAHILLASLVIGMGGAIVEKTSVVFVVGRSGRRYPSRGFHLIGFTYGWRLHIHDKNIHVNSNKSVYQIQYILPRLPKQRMIMSQMHGI
jgi:hypothetical protein